MKTTFKGLIAAAGLLMTLTANAAVINLGTLTPANTTQISGTINDNITDGVFGGFWGDVYHFTVDSDFTFASAVTFTNLSSQLFFNTALIPADNTNFNDAIIADDFNAIKGTNGALVSVDSSLTQTRIAAGTYTFLIPAPTAGTVYNGTFSIASAESVSPVPEQDSLVLMMVGFSLFGVSALRREKKKHLNKID